MAKFRTNHGDLLIKNCGTLFPGAVFIGYPVLSPKLTSAIFTP
jgi:hypothetical protein